MKKPAAVLALLALSAPAAAQTSTERMLRLSFDKTARVTLAAQHVTVREIMAEWARQCGCRVVNAERLGGDSIPIPLRFEGASQSAVLQSLLREAAGYILAPKYAGTGGESGYAIFITPTTHPVVAGADETTAVTMVAPEAEWPPPLPPGGIPEDEIEPLVPTRWVPERPSSVMPRALTTGANVFTPAPQPGTSMPRTAPGMRPGSIASVR